jgi:hypothetical protein
VIVVTRRAPATKSSDEGFQNSDVSASSELLSALPLPRLISIKISACGSSYTFAVARGEVIVSTPSSDAA